MKLKNTDVFNNVKLFYSEMMKLMELELELELELDLELEVMEKVFFFL
jgi:hypothetical protein